MMEGFTYLSLLMTPGVIILSGLVVFHWLPPALRAFRDGRAEANDWLILGIAAGFLGGLADNAYWGAAWHLDYTGHAWRDAVFAYGSTANVFFRQGADLFAALCHVVSAYMFSRARLGGKLLALGAICGAVTVVYALILNGTFVLPSDPMRRSLAILQMSIPLSYAGFATQVIWYVAKIEGKLCWAGVWALLRLASVFGLCAVAGYSMHLALQSVHIAPWQMLTAHAMVQAVMLRVLYRGRDAQRLAEVARAR